MGNNTRHVMPRARKDELIIRELEDETLVYDRRRDRAHCLNRPSALVWKSCDGKTPVAQLSESLEQVLGRPVSDQYVALALSQLKKFGLLEETAESVTVKKVSRRDVIRKYLPAGLVLPLIISIATPTAAQAGVSCAGLGQSCAFKPCCPGLTCDGTCFPD